MNRKANMACYFNFLIETQELLQVTGCHLHCKSGISETVQERDVVTEITNRK